jgi:hypothetical protein
MKHSKLLYGFAAVLGIVFIALFFLNIMFSPFLDSVAFAAASFIGPAAFTGRMLFTFFCPIVGIVFLIAGICGIGSQYLGNNRNFSALQQKLVGDSKKRSKFFGFLTVLGIVFLGTFATMWYLSEHSAEVTKFFMSTYPLSGLLMFIVFLFSGTGLLTVGICGIVRRYFKNNRNLFTLLVAVLVPSLILLPFFYLWTSALTVSY